MHGKLGIASLGQSPERPLSSHELTRRPEDLRSGEVDPKSQHRVIANEQGSLVDCGTRLMRRGLWSELDAGRHQKSD